MNTIYIILQDGDYQGWHYSMDRAIKRAEKMSGDVTVREMPSDRTETEHARLTIVWTN